MNNKGIIIQGSSRSNGNTNKIVEYVRSNTGFDFIDLSKKTIGQFDYDFANSDDDFIPMMKDISEEVDTIVFATPVYWYSMSGLMKVFFDRFTDLLRSEKEIGRKLRGKNAASISCGSGRELPDYFTKPFSDTAGYLGMSYLGNLHSWIENDEIPESVLRDIRNFTEKVK